MLTNLQERTYWSEEKILDPDTINSIIELTHFYEKLFTYYQKKTNEDPIIINNSDFIM